MRSRTSSVGRSSSRKKGENFLQGLRQRLDTARNRLASAIDENSVVELVRADPQGDLAAQQKRLLAQKRPPIAAVLTGGLESPRVAGSVAADSRVAGQLRLILADARSHEPGPPPLAMTKVQG